MNRSRQFPEVSNESDCKVCRMVIAVVYAPLVLLLAAAAAIAG